MRAHFFAAGAAALVLTFGHLSTASAVTCGLLPPVTCSGNTPVCPLLATTCQPCTTDLSCSTAGLAGTCVTEGENTGACYQCDGDHASGTAHPCVDENFPACHLESGPLQYRCTSCSSSNKALCTNSLAPACIADAGVCGCDPSAANVCGAGTACMGTDSGAPAQCVSTTGCDAGTCRTAPNTICDSVRNTCVECADNADCTSGAAMICVSGVCEADGGTPMSNMADAGDGGGDSGGGGGDDSGTVIGSGDGGDASTDGGIVLPGDATVSTGSGAVTYPYGHVDGGGCITGFDPSGTGSLASSFVTGLAALAGILSIRTRRRRNGQDQNR